MKKSFPARQIFSPLIMILIFYATLLLTLLLTAAPLWNTVFVDNFNGSTVNTGDWEEYYSAGNAGYGLRRPGAFAVSNGLLTVTARMIGTNLVSGGMADRRNYVFGKFEFRVRVSPDPSQATSGVLLTWPKSNHWPLDGENDIYETGTTRKNFSSNIHYATNNLQFHFTHNVDPAQWHTMACEWLPNVLRYYVDGTNDFTLTNLVAIPRVPHHLCIQLDAFKNSMTNEATMIVDWVKISQLAPAVTNGVYKSSRGIVERHWIRISAAP